MTKTVLITGSSRGIGLALVKECVSLGHKVIATCRNPSGASELKDILAKNNQPEALKLDVDNLSSIKEAFEKVKTLAPNLDILINNAGVMGNFPGSVLDTTGEDMLQVYKTNVVGPMLMNQTFLPLMNKAAGDPPVIVNMTTAMASIAENGSGRLTAYRCSKVAVNMMNVNFAHEAPDVIWVAMHPGWVDTDMGRTSGAPPPLKSHESASSIMKTLAGLKKKDSGIFVRYNGEKIPF